MKNFKTAIIAVFFILATAMSLSANEQISTKPVVEHNGHWVADEILVKFKDGTGDSLIQATNLRFAIERQVKSLRGKFRSLKIPANRSVLELVKAYSQLAEVEYAEPNYMASAHVRPNDTYFPLQWNFDNPAYGGINMEQAWNVSTGAPDIVVAVLDSGVAYEDYQEVSWYWFWRTVTNYSRAPDFGNTVFVQGYDFINRDNHPNDDNGHGTHVAGTIAQSTNNGIGAAGIAYDTAIMPVKVLDSEGAGSYSAIAEGIYYAADNGAKVINMSLGGANSSSTLRDALQYAYDRGVSIVCSSGNDGSADSVSYPAAYDDYCIAVGATRYDESVAPYSNGGASLDITAPGGDLSVDQNGDGYFDGILQQTFDGSPTSFGYWFYQGTSMAAPHVSGVAALLAAAGVANTPDEIREALQTTAEDHGPPGLDSQYGWGILDAAAALAYTAEPNAPPVADPGGPYSGDEDETISFDGTASFDPESAALTYSWNFGDGSTGNGPRPTHIYRSGGHYTVTLTVHDGLEGSTSVSTTVTITEIPDPPIAVANGPYSATEGDLIVFSANGSYDPEGALLTYSWDFGDGTTATGLAPSHTYLSAGSYTVTLVVNDGLLDSVAAVTSAEIEKINLPPVADVNGPYNAREGSSLSFDSGGSFDPEGASLTYSWAFGDGSTASGPSPSHSYGAGGVYTVSLVVNDGELDSNVAVASVTVEEVNEDPVANAGSGRSATTGENIIFNGSGSYDPDGTISSYRWTFGDGTEATGVSVSHAYAAAGLFTVTLTVTDNQGGTASSQVQISVTEPVAQAMHVASIDMSTESIFWGLYARASASVLILDGDNLPVPGAVVAVNWSGAAGGSASAVTGSNGRAVFSTDWVGTNNRNRLYNIAVSGVSLTDWVYDSPANLETTDSITR